ncbi:MAG TPA: GDP-mannose 4,6-dehydratase [candidate division Zixibacteria bacterium]|nr:GDP-mannose 4,6-dehydratase [candidate division Zixibacteria bacterium]
MVRVLITGGAGFIGYHLTKKLSAENFEVTIYDNFSDYYSRDLKEKNIKELEVEEGVESIEGCVLDREKLTEVLSKNFDYVFHLAAQPGIKYSTQYPILSLKTNIEGTMNVLSVSRENQIKRVIVASSSSVFGNSKYIPIDENHPRNPLSFYGVSKFAAEKIVDVCIHLYPEHEISVIRPFTVVGARQRPDMALNIFVTNAFEEKEINIYGTGEQTRDWTHVENVVDAFYLTAIKTKAKNEFFNIGSGKRTSVNKVLDLVSKKADKKLKINYKEFDKAEVKDTLADITKAKKLLNYNPKKTLEEAIEEFILDYKERSQK